MMAASHLKQPVSDFHGSASKPNSLLDCGWGRLLFAQTFADSETLAHALAEETEGRRDIAFYVTEPHVLLSHAPQLFFLDPSHSFRLDLARYAPGTEPQGFTIREIETAADCAALNRIYAQAGMVPVDEDFLLAAKTDERLVHLIAEDSKEGAILGTVTGVDHRASFSDPEEGGSLWCLAVDAQASLPGIGEGLVRSLADRFKYQGLNHLDLSVMHDNREAIALYRKLGFERIPVFTVKTKNPINEQLFIAPPPEDDSLNPYAMIIVKEARRRGIAVEVLDAAGGFFRLSHGGRAVTCREALSELTSAVAMSRCDDKAVTLRLLKQAGLSTPDQQEAGDQDRMAAFLKKHGSVVVKPARGEQGRGVKVDLRTLDEVEEAAREARAYSDTVLLESLVEGDDLRVIVINGEVVAAAIRRPAEIQGDGLHGISALIEKQSRRRSAATGGESAIPLDAETRRCVRNAGYELDSLLPEGQRLKVRKTANLHTGGTIHDVTSELHPAIAEAAVKAAEVLEIPVVGLDFIVPAVDRPDYVIIEANERPGLANHEPQPTAERFIDLLFPHTIRETK